MPGITGIIGANEIYHLAGDHKESWRTVVIDKLIRHPETQAVQDEISATLKRFTVETGLTPENINNILESDGYNGVFNRVTLRFNDGSTYTGRYDNGGSILQDQDITKPSYITHPDNTKTDLTYEASSLLFIPSDLIIPSSILSPSARSLRSAEPTDEMLKDV